MKQYEMFELKLEGEEPEGSKVQIDLIAEFEKDGHITRVKGFYAGNGRYAVRFYPEEPGTYHYRVDGIVKASGTLECEPADQGRHGIVRAAGTHFKYADGTWHYPFGTTVYALLHQEKQLIDQTMAALQKEAFNKVRICVFPKHYQYNENDPEYYAFEKKNGAWDVNSPDYRFWDAMEERIHQLDEMGIQCDLILFHPYDKWGFAALPKDQAMVYLDYICRRLSAFPNIWWSLANEYDLMAYQKEDWEDFAHFLHENDPYGHLLSNHHMVKPWDFSNPDTTHICVQIKNVDGIKTDIARFDKPMMVDECRYEGNIPMEWGNISGFEMVNRFWKVCAQGGYCTHGETFLNKEGILWWSKGGTLVGESPKRIGFLRDILESLPGPLEYGRKVMTLEEVRELKKNPPADFADSPLFQSMMNLSDEVILALSSGEGEFTGRCGDEAFLKYYERQCTCQGALDLPENLKYDVEVIDVWEMTKKKVLENVSGHTEIELPGKEGMAVLARKVG